MEELYAEFKGTADFATIYISEAHPQEGWRQNDLKWDVKQPTTTEERIAVARDWVADLQPATPYFVDPIEDTARFAFAAVPERLYILEDGEVKYQGGRGPFDYHPEQVEGAISPKID